jgi:hypothetical protein
MDEPKPNDAGKKPAGPCKCEELDPKGLPTDQEPFRRLLDALTKKLKELAKEPSEATNKFPDDLKDAEKEYQGIDAVVAKYKEFYDKQLDCKLSDAKRWRETIDKWSTIDQATKDAIEKFRADHYDKPQHEICCDTWIKLKQELNDMSDCLAQARNTEAQRQAIYDALKNFLDTLTKVFADLEALFKKAEAYNKEQKPKSVYAVSLEFKDVYKLIDWPKTPEEECAPEGGEPENGEYAQQPPPTPPSGGGYAVPPSGQGSYEQSTQPPPETQGQEGSYNGIKKKLAPDKFRARLLSYLRQLLLARYHRFLLLHELLTKTTNAETAKKECEKFKADRQKLFLEEVEDIPAASSGAGTGGTGGGTGAQTPAGSYGQQPPAGGYSQQPPTTSGYEKPSAPGYEGPAGGYEKPPGEGYEKPPAGGYQQKPPSGGYEKK